MTKKKNYTKREYKDIKYLLLGIVISAGLSIPSSFFVGWYFSVEREIPLIIPLISLVSFWIVFIVVLLKIIEYDKKSK